MNDDEDNIDIPKWGWMVLIVIAGIVAGAMTTYNIMDNQEYRSPEELRIHLEEMLFNYSHTDQFPAHLEALLHRNDLTLMEFKDIYIRYGQTSRGILEIVVNDLCYKKKWKDEKDD